MKTEENDFYMTLALVIICTVGLVGNVITLLILKKNKNYLAVNNSRLHIGHLALLDLGFSIINSISALGYIDKNIVVGTIFCNVIARITTIQVPLTFLTHSVIAVHRLQSLLSFGNHSQRHLGFLYKWQSVAAIWISSIIISCFLNIDKVIGSIVYKSAIGTCGGTGSIKQTVLTLISMVCIISIFICYTQIYRLVKSRNRQIRDQIEAIDAADHILKRRIAKTTKMLCIIFGSFVACNIPFIAVISLRRSISIDLMWQRVSYLLIVGNYSNNFFVYGLMDKEYRAKVSEIFTCKRA